MAHRTMASWPSDRRFLVLSQPRLAFGTVSAAFTDGCEGIDHETFHQLVRVQVAGRRYTGLNPLPGILDAAHGDSAT